jgi:hypothetical protein
VKPLPPPATIRRSKSPGCEVVQFCCGDHASGEASFRRNCGSAGIPLCRPCYQPQWGLPTAGAAAAISRPRDPEPCGCRFGSTQRSASQRVPAIAPRRRRKQIGRPILVSFGASLRHKSTSKGRLNDEKVDRLVRSSSKYWRGAKWSRNLN